MLKRLPSLGAAPTQPPAPPHAGALWTGATAAPRPGGPSGPGPPNARTAVGQDRRLTMQSTLAKCLPSHSPLLISGALSTGSSTTAVTVLGCGQERAQPLTRGFRVPAGEGSTEPPRGAPHKCRASETRRGSSVPRGSPASSGPLCQPNLNFLKKFM